MDPNNISVWLLVIASAANIIVTAVTIFNKRAEAKKLGAETDTSIPVDAANETTTVSLGLVRELREEIKRSKEDCQCRIKLLEDEIGRLNGRIKELEQNGCK
jgi:hypothetical protein